MPGRHTWPLLSKLRHASTARLVVSRVSWLNDDALEVKIRDVCWDVTVLASGNVANRAYAALSRAI
jgi:hypothetical protein